MLFFLAQHSCVLDYMCKNDTQGIEYVLVLGISVPFSGECCFLYSSAVYHHCTSLTRILFQCRVAYPQLMSNICEAQATAADAYSLFWTTKPLLYKAKKYADLSCPQLAAGGK